MTKEKLTQARFTAGRGAMVMPQCISCLHFKGQGSCTAFPDPWSIPADISTNKFDHNNPWPDGDNDTQFELRPDLA